MIKLQKNWRFVASSIALLAMGTPARSAELEIAPGFGRLVGHVLVRGVPTKGVRVYVNQTGPRTRLCMVSAVSDEAGAWMVRNVEPGNYTITTVCPVVLEYRLADLEIVKDGQTTKTGAIYLDEMLKDTK